MAKSDLVCHQPTLTPAAVLHERARIHRLGLSWCLVDEFGPPHCLAFGQSILGSHGRKMAKSDLVCHQPTLTPAAVLHERARIHRLGLSWCLVDEFGPPHCRTFCVKLTIHNNTSKTTETYEGLGSSIQAAKHAASSAALQHSDTLKRLAVTTENKTDRPLDAKVGSRSLFPRLASLFVW
ncbi:hypothetical protein AHF37_04797 [Paragonimus kellicotti]|nr:hypothetical protein AHF37_04797 [Paragonimus kellicotti]